ncbi:MAG TPA: ferritin-like domain-containing protein, partial [Polyangiaceae bacterium]|nr:ferritin-like domain-containing protein [Polyangiaceae bacterium]
GAAAAFGVDSIERWQYPDRNQKAEADGEECKTAPDRPACLAALEQIRAEAWGETFLSTRVIAAPGYLAERLLITQGGAVRAIDDNGELDALLGTIDTPEKLRLFLHYKTPGVACEHLKSTAFGYEVIGDVLLDVNISDCQITTQRQLVQIGPDGATAVLDGEEPRDSTYCSGRRPAGLGEQAVGSAGALARYLERQAYLEGASVEAFERFALELAALGAPAELVARARRAREDEVRHHALLVALGRRFDPDFACAEPLAAPARPRSLYEFALENAIEGCVRETWGALLACHQAARADDGAVRFASQLIANDETRHAELSWATHAWLLGRLSAGERATIEAAMQAAAAELSAALGANDGLTEGERG